MNFLSSEINLVVLKSILKYYRFVMNIIVLQHIKIEDPGYIKDLMLADNVNLTTIELDEGEKIPSDLIKV